MLATAGQGSDRPQEVSYTDAKVIGNGSFGVVYQAKLVESNELVAIKKVLQDKRFKVSINVQGFALPIAIVAKCEEIINLAQKIVIWRQLLAKEKSLAKTFVWRWNVTSG